MFKLDLSPMFWAPVRFEVPKEDGTGSSVFTFDVQFPRFSEPELVALFKPSDADPEDMSLDARVARRMVKGWRGVCDPQGEEIAFGAAALDRLLSLDGMGTAIVKAFQRVRPGAARGN